MSGHAAPLRVTLEKKIPEKTTKNRNPLTVVLSKHKKGTSLKNLFMTFMAKFFLSDSFVGDVSGINVLAVSRQSKNQKKTAYPVRIATHL